MSYRLSTLADHTTASLGINISNQTIMLHLLDLCCILLSKRYEMNFTDPNQALPASFASELCISDLFNQLVQVVVIIGVGVAGLA